MGKNDTVSARLIHAQQAISCTRKVATIGASNKIGDVLGSLGLSVLCVAVQRQLVKDPSPACLKDIPQWITAAAHKLLIYGCGNCGEQTAYAMVLLYQLGIRSLDYMTVAGGDHAFLVIGSADKGPASSFKSWGDNAVVCDPWDNKAYLGKTAAGKKAGAKTIYSLARVE
jgi:hypothetical protein